MGPQPNGSAKGKKDSNGGRDSSLDKRSRRRSRKPRESRSAWLLSMGARLGIWYCIIMAIFYYPSSPAELDASSATVCKPYLQARSYLQPYIQPYYAKYLEPYWNQARPHVDWAKSNVYTPAAAYSTKYYNTYVTPYQEKVFKLADDEWEELVTPHLKDAQKQAQALYAQKLAPYTKKASDTVRPYYGQASKAMQDAYNKQLVPAYNAAHPYALRAWDQGHHLIVGMVFPYVRWAEKETRVFLTTQLWPTIRVLYGENVEPQLFRISERLGRYKDGKRIQAVMDETKPLETDGSGTVNPDSAFLVAESVSASPDPPPEPESSTTPEVPSEAEIREKIETDLKSWQDRFAKAADKGAEDLRERVKDITDRQIEYQAKGVGNAHLTRLARTVDSRIKGLKTQIVAAVSGLSQDATDKEVDAAHEDLAQKIRQAGMAIRDDAMDIRAWKQNYDNETQFLVKAASDSTLAVIDNIRELGLQEIGMRWAHMEGVTYKDWSKYHTLKKTFDEWRDEVDGVATKHEGLEKARQQGKHVEDKGMVIAEDAARELARLKDVARYKLTVGDASDDFQNKKIPAAAVKAAQQIKEKIMPGSDSPPPSAHVVPQMDIAGISAMLAEKRASLSAKAEEYASDAAKMVMGSSGDSAESVAPTPPEAVVGSDPGVVEMASSKIAEAVMGAQGVQMPIKIPGTPAPAEEASSYLSSAASEAPEQLAEDSDKASLTAKKVMGGVAAGFVAATQVPILDDLEDDSITDWLSDFADTFSGEMAKLKSIMAQALVKPTPTQGAVKSVTSVARAQWSSAMSAAMGALYGPEPAFTDMIADGVADRYSKAVTAASYAMYGTPVSLTASLASETSVRFAEATSLAVAQYGVAQNALESISSVASERLAAGLAEASKQYTSAKAAVGIQPAPANQQYLAAASAQYYQALGLAHDRYSSVVTAASSAVYGTPTPVYESLVAEARASYAAATAAAGSFLDDLYSTAKSAAAPEATGSGIIDAAVKQYDEAMAAAAKQLAAASDKASVAYYGTSTGIMESMASQASDSADALASQARANWAALIAKASEQVYGQPTPWHEAYYSSAVGLGAQATDAATSQYAAVRSLVAELVNGKEADFTASVMARLSSAYATGFGVPDALASASSIASEARAGVGSAAGEDFFGGLAEQFDGVVSAASARVHGAEKGGWEIATGELDKYASAAKDDLSSLIYVSATGPAGPVTAAGAEERFNRLLAAASTSLQAAGAQATIAYADLLASVSSAVYGPEKGVYESATSRLAEAVERARARMGDGAGSVVGDAVEAVTAAAAEAASSVSSVAAKAVLKVKDEL